MNPAFERYIGIDYSGAQTPSSSLKGLRVYAAERLTAPQEAQNNSAEIARIFRHGSHPEIEVVFQGIFEYLLLNQKAGLYTEG